MDSVQQQVNAAPPDLTVTLDITYGGRDAGSILRCPDLNSILTLVRAMPDHVMSLSLRMRSIDVPGVMTQLCGLGRPAAVLGHLVLSVDHTGDQNPSPQLPRILLSRNRFPCLRSITLDGLSIRQDSDVLPQLHVLRLWNYPVFAPEMGRPELATVMQSARSVHTLELYHFLRKVTPRPRDQPNQVPFQLPALATFTCEDFITPIHDFLQEIDIGPNVVARIMASVEYYRYSDNLKSVGSVLALAHRSHGANLGFAFNNHMHELVEALYWNSQKKAHTMEIPAEYEPMGWIFPDHDEASTLLRSITNAHLHWSDSRGYLELVGTSSQGRNGQLICRVPVRDLPVIRYIMTTSALCMLCAHILLIRKAPLEFLKVDAALEYIDPMIWNMLLHSAPRLTGLHLHDTGRDPPLRPGRGVLAVFDALGVTCDPLRMMLQSPPISRWLSRNSDNPYIVAAGLRHVTLIGTKVTTTLLETIHRGLDRRASHLGKGGVLESLTLHLHADDPVTALEEVANERLALEWWAKSVKMTLTFSVTRMR